MTERDVFIAALQKEDQAQRQAYLDQACAGRPELRRQVEELLRLQENAGSFLEGPAVPEATGAFTPSPGDETAGPERPGTLLGPYRLLEQIGEGGFGMVFMAEQTEPIRRKVALKVLKPGMDSAQVVARFEAERQALALMDHPHIAHVFDGGTTASGRPYFVMELVRGIAITAYSDQKQLSTEERLELFVDVCSAVQHAHHKGVIHRDLKPSNVLVTLHDGKAVVKVIDFGIAKAIGQELTERTLFTGFAQMIGTPLYMSPEQAALSGLDVDTRSDVYSLGVLLYELLTGTTPFDAERLRQAGYDEMRRIIREEEPPRPSTRISTLGQAASTVSAQRQSDPKRLSRLFRGELDWVVMKALEKERGRRYESPSAFAGDVRRYLDDEPVLACPPSLAYRLRKFLRRNKTTVLVTSAMVLLLAIAVVGTTAGVVRKWQEDDAIGRQSSDDVREARQSMQEERWSEAEKALERAAGRLATGGPAQLRELVRQMQRDVVTVAGLEEARLKTSNIANGMPDYQAADEAYRKVFNGAFEEAGLDFEALEVKEAVRHIRGSAIAGQLLAALEDWAKVKDRLRVRGGRALWALARLAEEEPWRQRLLDLAGRQDGAGLQRLAEERGTMEQPPVCLVLLADSLHDAGRTAAAERLLRQAQQRHRADFWINFRLADFLLFPDGELYLSDEEERRPEVTAEVIACCLAALARRPESPRAHVALGVALWFQGRLSDAEKEFREALRLRPDYEVVHSNLGNIYLKQGKLADAIAAYRKASELAPDWPLAYSNLGNGLRKQKKLPEAVAAYRKAIKLNRGLAVAHNNLGAALQDQKKLAEAVVAFRTAIALKPGFALAHNNLGGALHDQGKEAEAIRAFRKAIACNPGFVEAYYNLGNSLQALKKPAEAEAAFRQALVIKPGFAGAWNNLGNALRSLGRPAEAETAYRKAIDFKFRYVEVHYNLGIVLAEQNRLAEAEAAFRTAIARKPGYAEAYCDLGLVLAKRGKLPEAIKAYHSALALDPNYPLTWNNLGIALGSQGKFADAVKALHKAIALQPDNAGAYFNLGHAWVAQQKWGEAAQAYRKASELRPNDAEAHFWLGFALSRQGKWPEAVAAYRTAIGLEPRHAQAYHHLGLALHQQGKLAQEVRAYRKAISLNPTFAETWHHLGNALVTQKRRAEAIKAYRKAIDLRPRSPGALNNLANALALEGQLAEAEMAWRRAIELAPDDALAHSNLGRALQQQGRFADAVRAFQRARAIVSRDSRWGIPAARMLREAERLAAVDLRLPEFLSGAAQPATMNERLTLARLCREYRQRYAAAARFYADAFAGDATLADNLVAGHRYLAACAAARAGCGQGLDAGSLDEKQRSRLRRQALDWLRADLAAWGRLLEKEPDTVRPTVLKVMRHWLQGADLAGVRGQALAGLPEDERQPWQKLWAEVAQVLARVEEKSAPR